METTNARVRRAAPTRSGEKASALRYAVPVNLDDLNNPHTLAVLSTSPGSKVLDVGCGPGVVGAALAKRRCSVWGIEVDPGAADAARAHCEAVIVEDVELLDFSAAFPTERFDVVLLLDVLEHLREPGQVLRRLAPLVNPGGVVMASIPNIAHGAVRLALLSGQFPYSEKGLLDRDHLRFFDATAVTELFREAGYLLQNRLSIVRDLDQTEIALDLSAYPQNLLSDLRNDPLALTYQFFVIAAPQLAVQAEFAKFASEPMLAERYQARVSELEQIVRQGESYVSHVEESLRQRETEISLLKGDVQSKEEYLVSTRAELQKAQAEIEKLRHDVASRSTECSFLEQDVQVKEEYLVSTRAELQKAQAEIEKLAIRANRLQEAEKLLDHLHAEVAQRQALLEAMEATRVWRLRALGRSLLRLDIVRAPRPAREE